MHTIITAIIQAFSDNENPFLFSDLAALTARSENKKAFQCQRRLGLILLKIFYRHHKQSIELVLAQCNGNCVVFFFSITENYIILTRNWDLWHEIFHTEQDLPC